MSSHHTHLGSKLDSIAVSLFTNSETAATCHDPLRAAAEFSKGYKSMKICLNRLFLDRLALPRMSINFWLYFCCILITLLELRRTFLESLYLYRASNFGEHHHWSAQNITFRGAIPLVHTKWTNQ